MFRNFLLYLTTESRQGITAKPDVVQVIINQPGLEYLQYLERSCDFTQPETEKFGHAI